MTGRAWHAGRRRTGRQGSGGLRRSKGSGSVSSSGPANHAAYAEIRNLAAPGNQSMTCAERESTKACLNPLQHTTPWHPGQILLSPDTISLEMRGWLRPAAAPPIKYEHQIIARLPDRSANSQEH